MVWRQEPGGSSGVAEIRRRSQLRRAILRLGSGAAGPPRRGAGHRDGERQRRLPVQLLARRGLCLGRGGPVRRLAGQRKRSTRPPRLSAGAARHPHRPSGRRPRMLRCPAGRMVGVGLVRLDRRRVVLRRGSVAGGQCRAPGQARRRGPGGQSQAAASRQRGPGDQ